MACCACAGVKIKPVKIGMPFGNNLMLMALVSLLVVAGFVLYLKQAQTEGFQQAGNGMGDARAFGDAQRIYFNDQADKALYTNPSLNLPADTVNAALASVDTDLSSSPDIDYSNFFVTDPSGYFFEKERAMCANIDVPKNLPSRKPRDRVGCGWYFYSDASRKSEGKIGTSRGPLFTNLQGGEWIWDLAKAQEKEEKKYCKSLKTCDAGLETAATKPLGPCGFCKDKGHAIPIQTNGAVKYSDTSCGSTGKRSAAECIEPPVVTASNGVGCGTAGRPSSNGEQRLYTQAECETLLKGIYNTQDSTCKSKDGVISYSVQCAPLNNPIVPTSPCTPVAGRLTTACLESLARSIGFTGSGAMLKLISRGASATPSDNDALAFDILRKEGGLTVTPEYYRGGPLTVQQVQSAYEQVFSLRNNPSSRVSTAAKWLSVGGVEMNFCDIAPTERGPFSTVCLQRAFRSAGCQPAGKKYPSERVAVSDLANLTWEQVNSSFTSLYNRMKSTDAATQDAALNDCLGRGTAFYRPPVSNAVLEGPAIGWGRPVKVARVETLLDGRKVYMIEEDGYTKMVAENGEGRFYSGPMTAFNKANWPTYNVNEDGSYRLRVSCDQRT